MKTFQLSIFPPSEPSISSAEVSPVRISVSPGEALVLRVIDRAFGGIWPEPFARFDRESLSWKTSRLSLFGELEPFSERWPRSGMIFGGTAYRLNPSVRLTDGIAGSPSPSLPTPQAFDATDIQRSPEGWERQLRRRNGGPPRNLREEVTTQTGEPGRPWPTPATSDYKGSSQPGQRRGQLSEATEPGSQGRLNPEWVEMLMGFPAGWTDLIDSPRGEE